jgi:hypothetical protein
MSTVNLHTCARAASGWQRAGTCNECERQKKTRAMLAEFDATVCSPESDEEFARLAASKLNPALSELSKKLWDTHPNNPKNKINTNADDLETEECERAPAERSNEKS